MRRLLDTRDFLYGRNDRHESRYSSTSAGNHSQDPRNRTGAQRGPVLGTTGRLRTGSPDCGAGCWRKRPGGGRAERPEVGRTHRGFPHHGAPTSWRTRQPVGALALTRPLTFCNPSSTKSLSPCFFEKSVNFHSWHALCFVPKGEAGTHQTAWRPGGLGHEVGMSNL